MAEGVVGGRQRDCGLGRLAFAFAAGRPYNTGTGMQIDQLVHELDGVTEEEIKVVEKGTWPVGAPK